VFWFIKQPDDLAVRSLELMFLEFLDHKGYTVIHTDCEEVNVLDIMQQFYT